MVSMSTDETNIFAMSGLFCNNLTSCSMPVAIVNIILRVNNVGAKIDKIFVISKKKEEK
jgi:hypothetical protein